MGKAGIFRNFKTVESLAKRLEALDPPRAVAIRW